MGSAIQFIHSIKLKSGVNRLLTRQLDSIGYRILFVFPILIIVLSFHSCAVNPPLLDPVSQRADTLLTRWMSPDKPGAAIAIVKDGQKLITNGYGLANLEYEIPVTDSSVFHVASISKQFTAFSILLLEQQGELSLDDDIRDYLSYIPDFESPITIRQLLFHTSGLRDQWELLLLAGWRLDDVITQNHIVRLISNQEDLNFTPGTEYLYSNTGYTLLAEIVGQVTGETFNEWTKKNIFEPLDMHSTHFQDNHEEIIRGRAYSYIPVGANEYKRSIRNYANVGATSLYTTADDMVKWLQNFDTGEVGGLSIIKKMETELGSTVNGDTLSYGYALFHAEERGLKKIYHGGDDAGFQSFFLRFPDQNFGIVVMGNSSNFSSAGTAHFLARLYLADEMEPASPPRIEPRQIENERGEMPIISLFRFFYESIINLFTDSNSEPSETEEHETESRPVDDETLKEYNGRFISDELDTVYNITSYYNYLIIEYRKKDYLLLRPIEGDTDQFTVMYHSQLGRLSRGFMSFDFNRDSEGDVTGFRINAQRVRNLKFERMGNSDTIEN